jgi:hypothetical protein
VKLPVEAAGVQWLVFVIAAVQAFGRECLRSALRCRFLQPFVRRDHASECQLAAMVDWGKSINFEESRALFAINVH